MNLKYTWIVKSDELYQSLFLWNDNCMILDSKKVLLWTAL